MANILQLWQLHIQTINDSSCLFLWMKFFFTKQNRYYRFVPTWFFKIKIVLCIFFGSIVKRTAFQWNYFITMKWVMEIFLPFFLTSLAYKWFLFIKILQALVYYNFNSKQKQTTKQNENTNDKRITVSTFES